MPLREAPYADEILGSPSSRLVSMMVQRYVERAAHVRHTHGSVRVALTPLHGVGGEFAMDALVRAGFSDVHVVESQFAPDPDFPTVSFPNPEEPGAVDALLQLGRRRRRRDRHRARSRRRPLRDRGADAGLAGACSPGDETGWLLGDYILSQIEPGPVSEATVVASTWCRRACWPPSPRSTAPGTSRR